MEENQIKAKAVKEFVDLICGAFLGGFVDRNTCTIAELHRISQTHISDQLGLKTKSLIEEFGEFDAKRLGFGQGDNLAKPVKVKPLVWSAYDDECDEARAVGSIYSVAKSSDTDWLYSVNGSVEFEDYATKEEAKQAAQKFYEKLILGSIE